MFNWSLVPDSSPDIEKRIKRLEKALFAITEICDYCNEIKIKGECALSGETVLKCGHLHHYPHEQKICRGCLEKFSKQGKMADKLLKEEKK